MDLLDGSNLVTMITPPAPHQQNIFDILKFWSHKEYFRELLRPDMEEHAMYCLFKNMIKWSHHASNKVMKLTQVTYSVVQPKLQDGGTKIVEPDPLMRLTLSSKAVGSQRRAYKIPVGVCNSPAWNNAELDELLDCLLELMDADEAVRRHEDEAWAGKAPKLTDGQKRTMKDISGRQKRRRRAALSKASVVTARGSVAQS